MSGLQDGTSTLYWFLLILILKPNEDKIFLISLLEIDVPIIFSKVSDFKIIDLLLFFLFPVIKILLYSPPFISKIIHVASFSPDSIELGSMPLSNLNLASVLIFNFLAVFLIESG